MRRTRIKICGIKDVASAEAAVAAGADAVGLVFVPGSPRRVTVRTAQQIVQALPAFVEPVGLFVDAPTRHIREVAAAVGLRSVQLHGHEHPGDVAALADLRIIKAIPFNQATIGESLTLWRRDRWTNLTAVLLDTPPPMNATLTGGSGEVFDWHALAKRRERGELEDLPPLVLAGGLTPTNVAEAIAIIRPYAVDVSSGVESSRGVKDAAKIRAFGQAVQMADGASANVPDGV